MRLSSRRRLAVALTLACCLSLMAPAAAGPADVDAGAASDVAASPSAAAGFATAQAAPNPCAGTVTDPAAGLTVISVQGFRFGDASKHPAKLVGVGPEGEVRWVHQMTEEFDVRWGYDVDPLPNGNLFVTADLRSERSVFYEFDPQSQEVVWSERLDTADTHDADLIDGGEGILIADMRNYDEEAERNDDRLFVYNRTTEEIEWEWRFDDHYDPDELEENYTDDWTHVNDVDEIDDGLYLASPRNFDQAIVVNRSTDEIEMRLGEDGNPDVLNEQHNPDYLESENGTPTMLVGDSENDRIVEYANPDGGERTEDSRASSDSSDGDLTNGTGWDRTWTLEGDLAWPRDADRLPTGNTLVTDSSNHRVVEVTPAGEIVWEFYAPWLVYDAARVPTGEHGGPTATDLNATGTYEIEGSAGLHDNDTALEDCHQVLDNVSGWAEGQTPTTDAAGTTSGDGTDDATATTTWESALDEEGGDEQNAGTDGDDGDDAPGGSAGVPGFGPLAALAGLAVAFGVARRRQ